MKVLHYHYATLPYRNTLGDVLKVPLDDPKSLCFRMCFYMVGVFGNDPNFTG